MNLVATLLLMIARASATCPGSLVEPAKLKTWAEKSPCYIVSARRMDYDQKNECYFEKVLCVFDGKAEPGTVNERHGCAVGIMNANTGTITGTAPRVMAAPNLVVADHKCAKGGLDELMSRPADSSKKSHPNSQASVGEMLVTGKTTLIQPTELIYASNPDLKKLFETLRAKYKK